MQQNSLLDAAYSENSTPAFVQTVMSAGADLAVSISGGKDSDAMIRFLAKLHQVRDWQGDLFALFCELG